MKDKGTASQGKSAGRLQTGPVQSHTYVENGWAVTTHWATVAGRQTLVGLDVRSFAPTGEPLGEGYAEVTQRILRRLPVSEIRERTRASLVDVDAAGLVDATLADEQTIAALRDAGYDVQVDGDEIRVNGSIVDAAQLREEIMGAYVESVGTMTAAGTTRRRSPAAGRDFLVQVAAFYRDGYRAGAPALARYVEQQLPAAGVLVAGERGARDRVRKWIQRAREEGLLPPAGQPPVADTPQTTTTGKQGRR